MSLKHQIGVPATVLKRAAAQPNGRSEMMSDDDILAEFKAADALLEGHFILSSGLRSPRYLQCARVLMDPARAERLARELASRLPQYVRDEVEAVVSPAMGGVIIGHEMGRALGKPAMFLERPEGAFELRRGFRIEPGTKVLMVEDVVTTGLSSREAIDAVGAAGGEVVAEAALVDRSSGCADLGVPFYPLIRIDVPTYAAEAVPPDLASIPRGEAGEPRRRLTSRARPDSLRLGVNIDHVATIRNARGGDHPDPVRAARIAAAAGADGITAHLREDRRHITDNDIDRLMAEIDLPLNLEMAATEEMLEIALRHKPHAACIVPERREERTTEGGLDAAGQRDHLAYFVESLSAANIRVSLFIEPTEEQVAAAVSLGSPVVEFHTGRYAHVDGEERASRIEAHCRLRGAGGQERDRAARRPRIDVRQCCARRRHPAGRRAQHRPFPDRRGDLHRARRERSSNARADGFGEMIAPLPLRGRGRGPLSAAEWEGEGTSGEVSHALTLPQPTAAPSLSRCAGEGP